MLLLSVTSNDKRYLSLNYGCAVKIAFTAILPISNNANSNYFVSSSISIIRHYRRLRIGKQH